MCHLAVCVEKYVQSTNLGRLFIQEIKKKKKTGNRRSVFLILDNARLVAFCMYSKLN